jgi:hypothetical protein
VAARDRLYGATMGSDHLAEIRASVSAHQDLGPGYDDAVAEGLVERIGAEIDKRIDAQLRRYGPPFGPQVGRTFRRPGFPGLGRLPRHLGPLTRPRLGCRWVIPLRPDTCQPGIRHIPVTRVIRDTRAIRGTRGTRRP